MSFYCNFKKKCVPEWKEYYFSYKVFKELISPFKKTCQIYSKFTDHKLQNNRKAPLFEAPDLADQISTLKLFETRFSELLALEIEKIDDFFKLKLIEFKEEWINLKENADALRAVRFERKFHKKAEMLRNAFHSFYKKVNFLIQFANSNCEAVAHILRKHVRATKSFRKMMEVL